MAETPRRTDWFRKAGWGVFTHYLGGGRGRAEPAVEDWNRQVESFDVPRLTAQLQEVGAKYYFITIGQNSGFFCSPNETYDRLVGREPSRLSRRDLIADIAEALEPLGIRTMAYLPSHAPADDRQAVEGLVCTPPWDASGWQLRPGLYLREKDVDERLSEFQRNWEAIVREWSQRWGRRVHGWWFDGCYHADRMYRCEDEPNFKSFADAARAGNSESIVAFNPGVRVPIVCHSEYEDYTAGEIARALPASCAAENGFIEQAQYHILTYVGQSWCKGPPRFSAEFVAAYTKHILDLNGVLTWDVPISADGEIPSEFVKRLKALRNVRP